MWIICVQFVFIFFIILRMSLINIYFVLLIFVDREFVNGLGDHGSIPYRVTPKTLKWYLIPPCLTLINIRYVSRVKWNNPRKGVAPFSIPRCSSY